MRKTLLRYPGLGTSKAADPPLRLMRAAFHVLCVRFDVVHLLFWKGVVEAKSRGWIPATRWTCVGRRRLFSAVLLVVCQVLGNLPTELSKFLTNLGVLG